MGKYVELVDVVKVYKWLYGKSILCGYVGNKKYICYYVVKSILVKVNIYIYVVKVKMWINMVIW